MYKICPRADPHSSQLTLPGSRRYAPWYACRVQPTKAAAPHQPVLYVPSTTQPSIQLAPRGKVTFCSVCVAVKPRQVACADEAQPLAVEAVPRMAIGVPVRARRVEARRALSEREGRWR